MTHQLKIPVQGTDRDAQIREAQNAVIARMLSDLSKARSTLLTTGRVGDGLACHVTQGRFEAVLDLGFAMGGECAGPSPGFFARAAIAGCVAMAVKMLAAREGFRFDNVDVTVETDFDDAALFGLGSGQAAPLETRIGIESQPMPLKARSGRLSTRRWQGTLGISRCGIRSRFRHRLSVHDRGRTIPDRNPHNKDSTHDK